MDYFSSYILLLPVMILAIWAQMRVSSVYKRFNKIASAQGITGAQAAKYILQSNGIYDVNIEAVPGTLSDHYDPRKRVVRLSESNYHGRSLAALAVSAHEVGHAMQHHNHYVPLQLRHSILPVTNLGSWAAFPLFFIGFLIGDTTFACSVCQASPDNAYDGSIR